MKHKKKSLQQYLALVFVLGVGIAVSITLFFLVRDWVRTKEHIALESHVRGYANAIENNLNEYFGALSFVSDYFSSLHQVNRQQFANFTRNALSRYPGIQAFSWNPLVKDRDRAAYETMAREEGLRNYKFTERSSDGSLVNAAKRKDYIIVYYIEPMEGNELALGYNIASESVRLQTIQKAFNTGEPLATSRITLVQETGDQFGILILSPVYQVAFFLRNATERNKYRKGLLVEVLRIGNIMEKALNNFPREELNYYLYDLSAKDGQRFLYSTLSNTSGLGDQPPYEEVVADVLHWSTKLTFGGRKWEMIFRPSSAYLESHRSLEEWSVLGGSLFLTVLFVLYLFQRLNYIAENEYTISKLQAALLEVRTLSGLLLICSLCKKIRDDKGYWNQIEAYIKEHTEADFSHGLCPDCFKKLYPELKYKKK